MNFLLNLQTSWQTDLDFNNFINFIFKTAYDL